MSYPRPCDIRRGGCGDKFQPIPGKLRFLCMKCNKKIKRSNNKKLLDYWKERTQGEIII